jgi:hypothetical protein
MVQTCINKNEQKTKKKKEAKSNNYVNETESLSRTVN